MPPPATGPENSTVINKILIVRTDRLGDVVLTLPMFPFLRKCYPDAHIALLLNTYTGEIVEGNPFVDELMWYDDGAHLIPFNSMCRMIREKRFDAVIAVYPTFRLAWLMFRAGIPVRIGTGYRYYSFLFNRKVFEHRKDGKRHEVEYNLRLLRELDCPADGRPEFFIDIPSSAESRAREVLISARLDPQRPVIVIHPGTGGSAREWPAENFGQLARRLAEHTASQIVVTGRDNEAPLVERVVLSSGGTAVPMAGKLRVKELAALIRRASLFVSNSTGPLHIAVAVGTPVLGLYPQITPMSAARWGPYTQRMKVLVPHAPVDCSDCRGGEGCACMASISVDEVYLAAQDLLSPNDVPHRGVPVHG